MKSDIEGYFDRLWPINRSLTGEGNRKTLEILSEIVDLNIKEVPSGTKCFDWEVPPEWNVKEAWIENSAGERIVDFADHNLHLVGYSEPYVGTLSFAELDEHLYTLPEQPTNIPYVTSYYKRRWGFCMAHNKYESLDRSDTYRVCVDTSFNGSGSMTMAEATIDGTSDREILFSSYICHPSLASNELSGPLVASFVYRELANRDNLYYTYRFAFHPETIGSICYLAQNGRRLQQKLDAGYVLTCLGDEGSFTYKQSRRENALCDRVTEMVLSQSDCAYSIIPFSPIGSDERQYCSPGFNLPVGSLMRTKYEEYPEYHTSADNKEYVSFSSMEDTVRKILQIVDVLEMNHHFVNQRPYGEPRLGKLGLYPSLGTPKRNQEEFAAMMWLLNLADGYNDMLAISTRSGIPLSELIPVANKLTEKGLLVHGDYGPRKTNLS
ncbi:DUF4910 domain-containing protein [Lewinella sp. JB7]|uniref:DUF4910 domain-containing protein n=1 Tax=Lewinella sp. JB7 TaxID=2962887 RepID=UPI0020C95F33|nr:DUF4910 domain-containing protein [Lewinella sp. JB7]MCP9236781.1 DUF4910 domain-containing protein [Lewinella sp. JB7]